jgi:CDP-glucose 4,6-dehydratase
VAERLLAGDAAAASAWNFGPDEQDARPVRWVAERVAERWPGGLEVREAPPDSAAGEVPALRLDCSRARAELGWSPHWDLARGLDATVSWYVGYRSGADMRTETLRQIAAFQQGEA